MKCKIQHWNLITIRSKIVQTVWTFSRSHQLPLEPCTVAGKENTSMPWLENCDGLRNRYPFSLTFTKKNVTNASLYFHANSSSNLLNIIDLKYHISTMIIYYFDWKCCAQIGTIMARSESIATLYSKKTVTNRPKLATAATIFEFNFLGKLP